MPSVTMIVSKDLNELADQLKTVHATPFRLDEAAVESLRQEHRKLVRYGGPLYTKTGDWRNRPDKVAEARVREICTVGEEYAAYHKATWEVTSQQAIAVARRWLLDHGITEGDRVIAMGVCHDPVCGELRIVKSTWFFNWDVLFEIGDTALHTAYANGDFSLRKLQPGEEPPPILNLITLEGTPVEVWGAYECCKTLLLGVTLLNGEYRVCTRYQYASCKPWEYFKWGFKTKDEAMRFASRTANEVGQEPGRNMT